jgi:succinylarginine dihydrolase
MLDMYLKYSLIFLACYLVCSIAHTLAIANSITTYNDPSIILSDVTNRSARVVLFELYSDPDGWSSVLENIASGSEMWLKVAVALHPDSDAALSEMLTIAVGEGLAREPENVFRVSLPEFELESICGSLDVDKSRYNSYERAIEAINMRKAKVSALADPVLRKDGLQCIHALEELKKKLAMFYGIDIKVKGIPEE